MDDTITTTPEFQAMLDEINDLVGRRITKEWDEFFGSMVLVAIPRQADPATAGSVTGWVHPRDVDRPTCEPLIRSFIAMCFALLTSEDVDPADLHQLIMSTAVQTGAAIVVEYDEEDLLGDLVKN